MKCALLPLIVTIAALPALEPPPAQRAKITAARESRIPVGRSSLYVREIGEGRPLVVLHGRPDFDHRYLLPDLDRLADTYRLIYYDQRGRGLSAEGVQPDDVTLASDLEDLDRVRAHLRQAFDVECAPRKGGHMRTTVRALVCLTTFCLLTSTDHAVRAAQGYEHFIVGNAGDVVTPTGRLAVLHGGGTDIDDIFVRMGAAAGGGDFVVLRASGTDAYNPYIFELCGCDSVETIIFKNRQAAFDPFVIARVRNAEAVWLAGGDQSDYVTYWKDTPIETELNALANRAPIGGLSAGTAVLGEFVYSALSASSLTSSEGLSNPFHRDLTLTRDFLAVPKLAGLITDQHLEERDRMGRTVAFLARLVHDGWTAEGRAIAIDRETALIVDPAVRNASVISTRNHRTPFVYFLRTPGPPEICAPKTPLTFRGISVYRVGPGGAFDLDAWAGSGGLAYTLSAEAGVLLSSRGEIY